MAKLYSSKGSYIANFHEINGKDAFSYQVKAVADALVDKPKSSAYETV